MDSFRYQPVYGVREMPRYMSIKESASLCDMELDGESVLAIILVGIIVVLLWRLFKKTFTVVKAKEFFTSNLPSGAELSELDAAYAQPLAPQQECRPECCCDTQWPVPADIGISSNAAPTDFEPSSIQCRSCGGRGCLCFPKGSDVGAGACTKRN